MCQADLEYPFKTDYIRFPTEIVFQILLTSPNFQLRENF